MAALAEIINVLLAVTPTICQNSDGTVDWMVWYGYEQDGEGLADRCITIYETAGPAPEETMAIEYPNFQVKIRGRADDYDAARAKWQEVFEALHVATIASGTVYFYAANSGPITLGQDEKRRPHLAINFRCMRSVG